MYYLVNMENTIRIPPSYIGEDLDEVSEHIVRETFEGTMDKEHGIIVVARNVKRLGEGYILHGDGAIYQHVEFEAITFKPEMHEVLDAIVCDVVEFGAFCHIGPLDALVHKSQIMDDKVVIDVDNKRMEGKEKKRVLKVGDKVRVRIVTVSLNEMNPRESKIGLTMRQPGLGKEEWRRGETQ
ncbi:MAG: DNA-directed RNA polymerase [Thermoplasmata archaeon]|nr:MAG: DNA-directed RNA polymerase [Thermoplasmata archaeon]RLF40919.1 MAG: DNA-directed RNA polymerase [Thermoplasmata archaeon]RLF53998.1 MAG: DNA-directed RNA polymerase [Thermoplasmata archaeon]HDN51279.1 DNA-directed RNA polymerase [Thermoplasmatales archaeon]